MFAIIRHAGYHLSSGSLTLQAEDLAKQVAEHLKTTQAEWREIRVSPSTRTRETGAIIASVLGLPVEVDQRLDTDGDIHDLIPPTEPQNIIFISHLPVITQMLRRWSRYFQQEEPPLVEVATGYLVDPQTKTMKLIK